MKTLIRRVFLFGIVLLLVFSTIDWIYSRFAMQSNYYPIESWYDMMHERIDADVVVMGNSRAWVHVSPVILDSILKVDTYNLGMDGSPINRQVHKYNIYRNQNKAPRLIIQTIDCFTFEYSERSIPIIEQFFPFFWKSSIRKEFFRDEPFSFAEKYMPMLRYQGYGFWLFKSSPRRLVKGYEGQDRSWDGSIFNTVESLSFRRNATALKVLDTYLSKVKSEGINVVFVYTPFYIGATAKMTNLDEMYATYQEVADKYDIPVLDYTYMDICYDTTYFYNAMHLNKSGAEIFSDSLANDIKRLGILDN